MTKQIAVYGSYKVKGSVKQRYWKRRKDGIKQRYWRKVKGKFKKEVKSGRYEFEGSGKELFQAIKKAVRYVPKDFVKVSAKDFLKEPEKYGEEGEWIDRPEVKSQ